jgi:[ribosomal protein S18]-alanine N-acetyltransferase
MTAPVHFRFLHSRDIHRLMPLNAKCFPRPWSAGSIRYDLEHNPNSQWMILEWGPYPPDPGPWWAQFFGFGRAKRETGLIFGFGAFWIIHGEMHITNIGVDPLYRGRGWGEVLLLGMLLQAIELGAEYASLEVRVSNGPAIRLYEKHNYHIVGRKSRYYQDNNEDAYDMETAWFSPAYQEHLNESYQTLQARLGWQDHILK